MVSRSEVSSTSLSPPPSSMGMVSLGGLGGGVVDIMAVLLEGDGAGGAKSREYFLCMLSTM